MSEVNATIAATVQTLEPGTVVELFELHLQAEVLRFHAGVNALNQSVVWQGQTFQPMPVEASGFEMSGRGSLPRPKLRVANIDGIISQAMQEGDDLAGRKLVRRRTMARYLDAANFTGGVNPNADPTAEYPLDVYYVDRVADENPAYVEFELASAMDVAGLKLPRRQIIQNSCSWRYRSGECGYAGPPVADNFDVATTDSQLDSCGKRLASCKLRFGATAVLPYGGFPAAGLVRT